MSSATRPGVTASQRWSGSQSVVSSRRGKVIQRRWQHNPANRAGKYRASVNDAESSLSPARSREPRYSRPNDLRSESPASASLFDTSKPRGHTKGARSRFSGLVPYSTANENSNSTPEVSDAPNSLGPKSVTRTSYPQPEKPSFFLQEKARAVLERQVAAQRQSTLTSTETSAFDEIWKIFEPTVAPAPSKSAKLNQLDNDYKNLVALFSGIPKPDDATTYAKSQLPASQTASSVEEVQIPEKQPAFEFSPFSMQSAREVVKEPAEDVPVLEERSTTPKQPSPPEDVIHTTAMRVIEDISTAFDRALTSKSPSPEQAMWTVCEEKIFPLIKLLTSARPSLASAPSMASSPASSQPGPHPLIPSTIPLVPLLSIVYPSALLLALRTFVQHHPHSPYPLSLLPSIKSLGPTSYVLGVNTHFYNTLLTLRWDVYSDLHGLSTLMAEMQGMGLEHDIRTRNLLKRIAKERRMDLQGIDYARHDTKVSTEESGLQPDTEGVTSPTAVGLTPEMRTKSIRFIGQNRERGKEWWLRPLISRQWAVVQEWKDIISRRLYEKSQGTTDLAHDGAGGTDVRSFTGEGENHDFHTFADNPTEDSAEDVYVRRDARFSSNGGRSGHNNQPPRRRQQVL